MKYTISVSTKGFHNRTERLEAAEHPALFISDDGLMIYKDSLLKPYIDKSYSNIVGVITCFPEDIDEARKTLSIEMRLGLVEMRKEYECLEKHFIHSEAFNV